MNGMRTPCLLLMLALSTSALAGETLPESSPPERNDQAGMKDRFPAPPMASDEMENLYLESPVELGNTEEEGMRSVQDKEKYSESDLLFRERRQGALGVEPAPSIDRPVFIPPPPPAQQL